MVYISGERREDAGGKWSEVVAEAAVSECVGEASSGEVGAVWGARGTEAEAEEEAEAEAEKRVEGGGGR